MNYDKALFYILLNIFVFLLVLLNISNSYYKRMKFIINNGIYNFYYKRNKIKFDRILL